MSILLLLRRDRTQKCNISVTISRPHKPSSLAPPEDVAVTLDSSWGLIKFIQVTHSISGKLGYAGVTSLSCDWNSRGALPESL